jgi:hypothetical protein
MEGNSQEGVCPGQPVRWRVGEPAHDLLGHRPGFALSFLRGVLALSNCQAPASTRAGVLPGACPLFACESIFGGGHDVIDAALGQEKQMTKDWANKFTWLPIVKLTVTCSF